LLGFKTFTEAHDLKSALKNLFKNDTEFWALLKKAHTDEDITKIVEYITSKYSVELNKLMKQFKVQPVDLAKYILQLKEQ